MVLNYYLSVSIRTLPEFSQLPDHMHIGVYGWDEKHDIVKFYSIFSIIKIFEILFIR